MKGTLQKKDKNKYNSIMAGVSYLIFNKEDEDRRPSLTSIGYTK